MKRDLLRQLLFVLVMVLTASTAAATKTITGYVYDIDDDGVQNVAVSLYDGETQLYSAKTNSRGKYEMDLGEGLVGTYTLKAVAAGYKTVSKEVTLAEDADNLSEDFTLVSSTAVVQGSVVDATSSYKYISWAEVKLSLDGVDVASAETFYGTFSMNVNDVVDRPYTITISCKGYDTYKGEVTLVAGETANLQFKLYPEGTTPANGTTVKGNVSAAQGGEPISGAAVVLKKDDATLSSVSSDADGAFEIKMENDVLDGYYYLEVSAEGYQTVEKQISIDKGSCSPVSVLMEEQPTSGSLSIVVSDAENGRQLSDVKGVLSLGETQVATAESYWGIMEFEVDNVSAEPYTLTLTLEGYETLTDDNILLVAGETVSKELAMNKAASQASTTVAGKAVAENTGKGLSGVRVALMDGETTLDYEYTGSDGAFSITIGSELDGKYTVSARRDGYASVSKEITIVKGQCEEIELVMALRLTTLNISVVNDATGELVENAKISIEEQYDPVATGVTDENGLCTIEFACSPYVEYDFTVTQKDYKPFTDRRTFEEGAVNDVEVRLYPYHNAVEGIDADSDDSETVIFDVNGLRVHQVSSPGVYIVCKGGKKTKLIKH